MDAILEEEAVVVDVEDEEGLDGRWSNVDDREGDGVRTSPRCCWDAAHDGRGAIRDALSAPGGVGNGRARAATFAAAAGAAAAAAAAAR